MPRGAFCAGALLRSEPKPCGARPRSVAWPCASQLRLLPGRCPELFASVLVGRLELPLAEGGRSCASWRWRAVISELPEVAAPLPGRFSNWPLALMLLCAPELPTCELALAPPPTPLFTLAELLFCAPPKRPAVVAPFIVRTDSREAAGAGAVRAMTERFWMALDGRATCELKFAAPSVLCCVGRMPTEFETRAPFKPVWVSRCPPRFTRSPFMNPLRDVVVTARRLCAFAKL